MYNMIVDIGQLDDLIHFPLSQLDEKDTSYFIKHLNIELDLLKKVFLK